MAENASSIGVNPSRIAVAGDSAGGNLAAVTALLARDRGGPPLRFQLLLYPVTDLTLGHPSIKENGEGYMLTAAGMKWFADHYLGLGEGGEPGAVDAKDPIVSPFFANDLTNLPPALVVTAEFDPLRDEGEAYASRMKEAGGRVTVKRYDGLIHGFFGMGMVLDAAKAAVPEIAAQLRDAIA